MAELHLGAELVTLTAYSWVCNICKLESTDLVNDQEMILTMMRIHNQRAKHVGAYGCRPQDMKCPICTAQPNHPCVGTAGITMTTFHDQRTPEYAG